MDTELPPWAVNKNFFHHSNSPLPDGHVFWNKCEARQIVNDAFRVLNGELKGDKKKARDLIDKHKHENPNMHSGIVVQEYVNDVLLDAVNNQEAYRTAVAKIQEFTPLTWHDTEKESAVINHKLDPKYTPKIVKGEQTYKKDAEGTFCELELVCKHALEGVQIASQGINKLEGERNLFKTLPGTELPYNGRPDFSERIELKTMWDINAHTDAPRSNSIPKEPRAAHLTQVAGYYFLSKHLPTLVYANRNGYKIFKPSEDELKKWLDILIERCERRERLLKAAATTEDLLRLCDPEWDHMFAWKDTHPEVLAEAKKIFGGKTND